MKAGIQNFKQENNKTKHLITNYGNKCAGC